MREFVIYALIYCTFLFFIVQSDYFKYNMRKLFILSFKKIV